MAVKPIEGPKPFPSEENLAFLKGRKNISSEESDLLAVAALNGNDILEEGDFEDPRAKALLANFQVPPKPLPWSRELILKKAAERIVRSPFPQLLADLLKEAFDYMKYTPLSEAISLIELLARQVVNRSSPSEPRALKATFRTLMYISEFMALNRQLKLEGKEPFFSDEFENRMREVMWLIIHGRIRFRFQAQRLEERLEEASFDPRTDQFGCAVFTISSEDIEDGLIIHEAIHAAQQLEDKTVTSPEREREAFILSAQYMVTRYGFENAYQMASADSEDSSQKNRLIDKSRKEIDEKSVSPVFVKRLDKFLEIFHHAFDKVQRAGRKYKSTQKQALDYARLKAANSPKTDRAFQILTESVIARYGLHLLVGTIFRFIQLPATTNFFSGGPGSNLKEYLKFFADMTQRMHPELSEPVDLDIDLADAAQAAVEQNDMPKAKAIIDKKFLPKLWKFIRTHPMFKPDWSELRKGSPFFSAQQ